MSPRPPMRLGTFGSISRTRVSEGRYKARARFRGHDGVIRTISRFGQTKAAAEAALRDALSTWQQASGELTRDTKVSTLAAAWLTDVDSSDRAAGTKGHYRYVVDHYINPELGQLRIGEATTQRCDAALKRVTARNGPSAARSTRAALNGMFSLAVRHDAISESPIRETTPISVARRLPRALDVLETEQLTDALRSDERAVGLDLPDLVDFMLCTGVRIGEAMAVRRDTLTTDTVEVNATVIRVKGCGLVIQEKTKSTAGWRLLPLPAFAREMIERRNGEVRFQAGEVTFLSAAGVYRTELDPGVLLPAPRRRSLRDPSNTAGDLREVLDRLGFPWVTSHTFRKTAATRLEQAGFTPLEVATFMGHAQPSMTMNVYFGRPAVRAAMATALDR